jgi:RNA polymerase sigma-70 factor (ECF subfamily)
VSVELEGIFHAQYSRIAKLIASITRDPGRAEELAVEVFLKWTTSGIPDTSKASGWLHRTAVRLSLDELRRRARRERLEGLVHVIRPPRTPEEIHLATDRQARVTAVLARLKTRDAEILLLRAEGMTYDELASTLSLKPASIGTLLSRAQQAFRKEYIQRYGKAE